MALEEKIIQAILESHSIVQGNSGEASRYLEKEYHYRINSVQILNQWRKHNLEPAHTKNKGRIKEFTDEEKLDIIKAHERYGGSINKTSRALHYSHKRIRAIWEGANLEVSSKKIIYPESQ